MSKFVPNTLHSLIVNVDGVNIPVVQKARNLGVIMDRHLSMSDHITKTCQSAVSAIPKIGQIRHYLNLKSIAILVHSLIISHVDN